MGCCLFASIMAGAPRFAFLLYWLFRPIQVTSAFSGWLVPILGVLFLPWTTLMYVMVHPGGISTVNLIFLGLALAIDIGTYGGGGYGQKQRRAS